MIMIKKHPLTNCLLSLAFVSMLFSCGSRRTLQHTVVDVTSRHIETVADTEYSVASQSRTVTDTSSTTSSSVTLERDTLLLQWDTVGNQAVLTSAVRIHMLSRLMASEVSSRSFDDILAKRITDCHIVHNESDSLSAIEDNITDDEPPTQVRSPTRLGKVITGLLYLLAIIGVALIVKILLRLAHKIKHPRNV